MKDFALTYRLFGTTAILIEWPQIVDEFILEDILAFEQEINRSTLPHFVETVSTFASLTVFFDHVADSDETIHTLKGIYKKRTNSLIECKTWEIPVCYGAMFGEDIQLVAKHNKITSQEVIDGHCKVGYRVHFIGFLPGFLYLGGLPGHLHCPRKQTPGLLTKKGAVGIGGGQTGIYPINSPGGWNIIGNTPVPLFNPGQDPPCFIKPGDMVKFRSIDLPEYNRIESEIYSGSYNIPSQKT